METTSILLCMSIVYLYIYIYIYICRRPSLRLLHLFCAPSRILPSVRTSALFASRLRPLCAPRGASVASVASSAYCALARLLALAIIRSLSGWHARAYARAQPHSRAFSWPLGHCGARTLVHSVPRSSPAASVLISSAWRRRH